MSFETAKPDRRQNHVLRAVIDEACERLEPFMDPSARWGNAPFALLMHHCLLESFPQLTAQEAQTLACAIQRTYSSRRRNAGWRPPTSQVLGTRPAQV